jgi:hypothetical protein
VTRRFRRRQRSSSSCSTTRSSTGISPTSAWHPTTRCLCEAWSCCASTLRARSARVSVRGRGNAVAPPPSPASPPQLSSLSPSSHRLLTTNLFGQFISFRCLGAIIPCAAIDKTKQARALKMDFSMLSDAANIPKDLVRAAAAQSVCPPVTSATPNWLAAPVSGWRQDAKAYTLCQEPSAEVHAARAIPFQGVTNLWLIPRVNCYTSPCDPSNRHSETD